MGALPEPSVEPLPPTFVGADPRALSPSLPGSFLLPCPELREASELKGRAREPLRLFPAAPALFPWLERAFAPGKATALVGPPTLVSGFLPFLLAAVASHGGEVSLRDGSNRFSPYAVGALSRRWAVDPNEVLGRIRLARAFTAHQMVTLVETWADTLLSRHVLPSLLVASDPTILCQDAEVPPDESVALQMHMAEVLGRLARSLRRPLLLTQERTGGRLVFPGFAKSGPAVQETLRLLHGPDGAVELIAQERNDTLTLLVLAPHQRHLEEFDTDAPLASGPRIDRPTEVTPWDGLFPRTATP
ncbi:MAG: hypothetical protein KGJ23_03450 [Euryarchaeota archaeon]|nr:hypothetical protein [Euryarchaeota archaeon]MDE1835655.1 hypothetical protein [Euryarchaeota archaeon]MDE1879003.1 hypothetical protein [Euryarchaeota archaeon]MDE2043723.1 hypothetical protein [Thermoplasmata archaeon]